MLLDDTELLVIIRDIKYERIIKRKGMKTDVLYAMDLSTDRMRRQRDLEDKLTRERDWRRREVPLWLWIRRGMIASFLSLQFPREPEKYLEMALFLSTFLERRLTMGFSSGCCEALGKTVTTWGSICWGK